MLYRRTGKSKMGTKKVTAIVTYPVSIQLEVNDDLTEEEIEELVLNNAEQIFESSTIEPVIHDLIVK